MPLREITFKLLYNSGESDLVNDFYLPCFRESVKYYRAVGFFTSEILRYVSRGLNMFLANEGAMRLVCSPRFNDKDIKAIQKGYKDRHTAIIDKLVEEVERIPNDIINTPLNFLSWLIAQDRLDIKVALPTSLDFETYGIYHEKAGIFIDDEENAVAFSGSNNETLNAVLYNYESFDVFCSWRDSERCAQKLRHFDRLWSDDASGVETYEFPEAVKMQIIEKVVPQTYSLKDRSYKIANVKKNIALRNFTSSLWYFQREAIDEWEKASSRGIFSMATGTGKTRAAIGGLIKLQESHKRIFAVISCPQNTIIKQWESDINELEPFDISVIADSSNNRWRQQVADSVIDYNSGNIDSCVVYTTYNTLSSDNFTKILLDLKENSLLICDEVHWAGAETFCKGLLPVFKYRLGLSATPERYMDDVGSEKITKYFGGVVFEFSLERALGEENPNTKKTFLCPYTYHPIFVELNHRELSDYLELTARISKQYAIESKREELSSYFQRLCEQRQKIITNAYSKYEALYEILDSFGDDLGYLLIYCSPEQIDEAQNILNAKGIINHRFTGREGIHKQKEYGDISERDYILSNFEKGAYKALVAMKCLDEGVNILRAETSILMASSGNPKEYIQRRGRLLRRHPQKKLARIYDIIVLPYLDEKNVQGLSQEEVKMIEKELKRYEHFAKLARNKLEALNTIVRIMKIYNIL